jgi:hypothetical protein
MLDKAEKNPRLYFQLMMLGVNFTNIFGTKTGQLLRRYFSMILMATVFGKNGL